jgi:hypothetical protein
MRRLERVVCSRRTALALVGGSIAAGGYLLGRAVARSGIPFLITADVHNRPQISDELAGSIDSLERLGAKATYLIPANLTLKRDICTVLRRIVAAGHQVGCHGFDHDREDYFVEPFEHQREHLTRAKLMIEDVIARPVTAFRAPAFRISKYTLNILDSLGFLADLSICSQRFPLLSSQIGNYHWLFAPRAPYHPSPIDPYAVGSLNLLEIPTSAAFLPFMSSLNSVSVLATKMTTTILRYEATFRAKPIVYQCHPEDFVHYYQRHQPMKFTWRSILPKDGYGIPLRWALEETDGDILYDRNRDFFGFLKDTKSFHFQTVDDYLKQN